MGRTQHEPAAELAEELGLSERAARRFLRKLLAKVADDLVDTGRVELRGLGTFKTVERPGRRKLKNPKTDETYAFPTNEVVEFRASVGVRQRLLVAAQA